MQLLRSMAVMRLMSATIVSIVAAIACSDFALAADQTVVPKGAVFEELWNEGEFTEGVAAAPDGRIYFSDIPSGDNAGRVLMFDPASGKTSVFCADSGKSNGLMFNAAGHLIAACGANGGKRALCEIAPDDDVRILVDHFKGQALNSPNDLVIHPDGSIYFSDPRYVGSEAIELDHQSVYRFLPSTGTLQRVTKNITKPNGVIISPDGDILYVAETDNGSTGATEEPPDVSQVRMTLNAFSIEADGTLGEKRVIQDFKKNLGIDGMTVDVEGNLYAALRSEDRHGILILSPRGDERGFLPTDDLPTNCCFGRGEQAKTLYVTIGGGLYRVPLNVDGYHLPQS